MDSHELRLVVEELQHTYTDCLDDDRLEEWPGLFTRECIYRVVPRENFVQGLPLAIMFCDNDRALTDRVTSHRNANLFAPHVYRHLIGRIKIVEQQGAEVATRCNYAVFRTALDPVAYGSSELFSVGEYRDRIVIADGIAKFKEKIVIIDTCKIQSLLATPL
jgi:anthranilate 1,2-dioxygenase small subunit